MCQFYLDDLPRGSAGGRRASSRLPRGASRSSARSARGANTTNAFLASDGIKATEGGIALLGSNSLAQMLGAGAANIRGLALETIVAFFTAAENTTLALELVKVDGGEYGGLVELGGIVVSLMDGHGGVDNCGLNRLLLDYRLDGLMDVMVHVFTSNSRGCAFAMSSALDNPLVLELLLLGRQRRLQALVIAVVKLPMLSSGNVGLMLLGKNLLIDDRLDGAVVVVLVNLLVDGGVDLLVLMSLVALMGNGRSYCLVDSSIVVTGLSGEGLDGFLDLIHGG